MYLDMIQIYLTLILKETMHGGFILQRDGAPDYLHTEVTSFLSAEVPVWRGGVLFLAHMTTRLFLPRSTHFGVWGFVKSYVYRPPLQKSIPELKSRISTVLDWST